MPHKLVTDLFPSLSQLCIWGQPRGTGKLKLISSVLLLAGSGSLENGKRGFPANAKGAWRKAVTA